MRFLLVLIFVLASLFVKGQGIQVQGQIENLPNQKLFLACFYGDEKNIIDSTRTDSAGAFSFRLEAGRPRGMYRIFHRRDLFLDIVHNGEDVRFKTRSLDGNAPVLILDSFENLLFQEYRDFSALNGMKLDLLRDPVDFFPKQDLFYQTLLEEFIRLKNEREDYINSLIQNHPASFTARLAAFENIPYPPENLPKYQQKLYMQTHYFENTNFQDTAMLLSNALGAKIIGYLSLYQNSKLPK